MGKLSSILLGTVSGAALALFLTSDRQASFESSSEFSRWLEEKIQNMLESRVCEKLTEVKEQGNGFCAENKGKQVESGEITFDSVPWSSQKPCARQATERQKKPLTISKSNGKNSQQPRYRRRRRRDYYWYYRRITHHHLWSGDGDFLSETSLVVISTMQKKPTSAYVHIPLHTRFVIIVTFKSIYQESTSR